MIPDPLREHIETKLGQRITGVQAASGGSINRAARVELEQQGPCFLKWNTDFDPGMFEVEVKGLQLLRSATTGLQIPEPIDHGTLPQSGTGYLLMEGLYKVPSTSEAESFFGRGLAALHRNTAALHGLDHDNYIGRLPQRNERHESWSAFFVEQRMKPMVRMAIDRGRFSSSIINHFQAFYRKLPGLMPEEPASLLHGDLWGGNHMATGERRMAIYDPAVYYGSREIEIAFTHLFGGFPGAFYRAYEESWAMEPGFKERVPLYNLYPLLTHTNMFGGSYARQVESIISRF